MMYKYSMESHYLQLIENLGHSVLHSAVEIGNLENLKIIKHVFETL